MPDAPSLFASLRALLSQPTISPRPWELIFDRGPVKNWDGMPAPGDAPIHDSFRIVDANGCLLVRIHADPEQALKAEDMQLIVTAVNAIPEIFGRLATAEDALRRIAFQTEGDVAATCVAIAKEALGDA